MIRKYKLFESPDHLTTKNGKNVSWCSDDAYVFGYYNDKMLVTTSPGKCHGELNGRDLDKYVNAFNDMSLEDKHYFLYQYSGWSNETIKKRCKENTKIEDLPKSLVKEIRYSLYSTIEEGREELKYSGRLWKKHKYITFWDFPKDYDELWKVLNDIMDAFEKRGKKLKITDDWFIEVVTNEEGEQIENDYKWWGESEIEGPMEGYTDNSKIIKIKDYMGSVKFSEKERAIHLLSWAEKQELKKKGWGKGWGSDLTAWDSKNPLWWRQAKYQENKQFQTSFKLFENPNAIWVKNDYGKKVDVEWRSRRDICFSFFYGKFYYGEYTHSDLWIKNNTKGELDQYKLYEPELTKKEFDKLRNKYLEVTGRGDLSGRLFMEHKIITFWEFPKNQEELLKVVDAIKEHIGIDIWNDEWKIEILTNKKLPQGRFWGDWDPSKDKRIKYIPIKDYKKSEERSKEEFKIPHLMNWKEKQELKAKGWGKGFGSDMTAWDSKNPLAWRQAKYQENAQFYYKKELNPKFWSDDIFNERIRQKLVTIATEFYTSFGYQSPIIDIILTGSLSNYNWNEYSDLDVHILVDVSKINTNVELAKKTVDNERALWNLKHNIRIKGHDVELYIQDINDPNVSQGIYSLLNNKWISKPTWNKPQIDEEEVNFKYLTYKSGIDRLEEISQIDMTPEIANKNYLFASEYKKKIHGDRKIGLEKSGEFSLENLVFKKLRNGGDFGRLMQIVNRFYDKIYTQ